MRAGCVHDRPLAVAGLTSYRCRLPFDFIMIGARNADEAFESALRSSSRAKRENLEVWSESAGQYASVPDQSPRPDLRRGKV